VNDIFKVAGNVSKHLMTFLLFLLFATSGGRFLCVIRWLFNTFKKCTYAELGEQNYNAFSISLESQCKNQSIPANI